MTNLTSVPRPAAVVAEPSTLDRVARTIAAGFQADPIPGWIFPDPTERREHLWRFFRLFAGEYARHGTVYRLDDDSAGAVWAPPGRFHFSEESEAAVGELATRVLGEGASRMFGVMEAMGAAHPEDVDHYYLMLVATDPALHGRGLGRVVLKPVLDRCDRERLPAYLESSNPRNISFYERLGFVARKPLAVPEGCPPLVPMWREPQSRR